MQKRRLGSSALEIFPLVFGGNVFGWTVDEATSFKILDAFFSSGLNCIDTADVYSRWIPGNQGGESETIIGKWFKQSGNRDKIVLATKVGMEMGPDKQGLSKNYILRAVEDSLRRLQTDYIDLYQSHKDDLDTPQDEALEAYAILIQQGKVRSIGASNFTRERLLSSIHLSEEKKLPRYECLQPLYNLYDREDFEKNLNLLCQEQGIGVIPFFSLASGFLTGKYRSQEDLAGQKRGERVAKYLDDRGMKILKALDHVVKETGHTHAQVSLAWLMSKPAVTAPIASASNLKQLEELIKAVQLKLDPALLQFLDQESA